MELYFNDKQYKLGSTLYESFLTEDEQKEQVDSEAKKNMENILNDKNKIKNLLAVVGKKTQDANGQNNENTVKNLETLQNTISNFSLN